MTHTALTSEQNALYAALDWLAGQGVDCLLTDQPIDRTVLKIDRPALAAPVNGERTPRPEALPKQAAFLGASQAKAEAIKLAAAANSLEELKAAIESFEGLAIKKTANSTVFSDGNPKAHIMLVGEAPGAEEDLQGKPFVGESGQLLDKIIAAIGISRASERPEQGIYIANILNWRPPGNRTPSPEEVEVSLPFIERHIQLAAPKILILCGGVSAKALLGRNEGVSRLRKTWHEYRPLTPEITASSAIQALATYHPSYLLRTPAQKKLVWSDMLEIAQKIAFNAKNM